jgi:hypothetical protein
VKRNAFLRPLRVPCRQRGGKRGAEDGSLRSREEGSIPGALKRIKSE